MGRRIKGRVQTYSCSWKNRFWYFFQSCSRLSATATRWHQISFYFVQMLFTFLVQGKVVAHLTTVTVLNLGFKLFNCIIMFCHVGFTSYLLTGKVCCLGFYWCCKLVLCLIVYLFFNYPLIPLVFYVLCSAQWLFLNSYNFWEFSSL